MMLKLWFFQSPMIISTHFAQNWALLKVPPLDMCTSHTLSTVLSKSSPKLIWTVEVMEIACTGAQYINKIHFFNFGNFTQCHLFLLLMLF